MRNRFWFRMLVSLGVAIIVGGIATYCHAELGVPSDVTKLLSFAISYLFAAVYIPGADR